jgi:hypothetical protein
LTGSFAGNEGQELDINCWRIEYRDGTRHLSSDQQGAQTNCDPGCKKQYLFHALRLRNSLILDVAQLDLKGSEARDCRKGGPR